MVTTRQSAKMLALRWLGGTVVNPVVVKDSKVLEAELNLVLSCVYDALGVKFPVDKRGILDQPWNPYIVADQIVDEYFNFIA